MIITLLLALLLRGAAAESLFAADSTYQEWLGSSASAYDKSVTLLSRDSGVELHWKVDFFNVTIAMVAPGTGWAGIGIAESGGMIGADILYYEASSDSLTDSYVLDDYTRPFPDDCQSWRLLDSVIGDEILIFEATRALDSQDNQDRPLLDHGDFATERVIAAWGDAAFNYHGFNVARGAVKFFGSNSISEEVAAFRSDMDAAAIGDFSIMADSYTIPSWETVYERFCINDVELRAAGVPLDEPLHIIGIEPLVDEATKDHIHHFVVRASSSPFPADTSCFEAFPVELAYAWAPGEGPMSFPANVGGPLGGDALVAFQLEIHYDNPERKAGMIDNSGVRFYYSDQLREHDLGVLQVGDPFVSMNNEPVVAAGGYSSHKFTCGSECTSTHVKETMHVIGEYLHMHKWGTSVRNEQYRNGELIRTGESQFWDFDQQGSYEVVQRPFEVQPGDSFEVTCNYHSDDDQLWGFSSRDEMCIAFLFYYPRQTVQTFFGVTPVTCGIDVGVLLPGCDATHNSTEMDEEQVVARRTFGKAMDTCSASFTGDDVWCFPGSSMVTLEGGDKPLSELQLGDRVLVDHGKYEPVYAMAHYAPDEYGDYLELGLGNERLRISSDHMVFSADGNALRAADVAVGDKLQDANGNEVIVSFKRINKRMKGVFAPLTPSGRLMVDGILVSSYASFRGFNTHAMAHAALFPHRLICYHLLGHCHDTLDASGVPVWMTGIMRLVDWFEDRSVSWVLRATMAPVVLVFGILDMLLANFQYILLLLGVIAVSRRARKAAVKKRL